ncbi:MAG: argininosuccinate lyase [Betaproteobacteria bacterium]|nr:argininosuccinate lyase [Betaproteobacteria bacterium]
MSHARVDAASLPKGARDRMRAEANAVFARHILEPIFEINCRLYFRPLIAAHRAWLLMLAERGIVSRAHAVAILRGLEAIEQAGPDAARPFDPALDYYYLHIERALVQCVPGGESVVGNLNLGRTRPEPLARMVVRESLCKTMGAVDAIRRGLVDMAEAEAGTVMPGYTHLQHAQPTTLGHYLLSIQDHLARDAERLLAAYDTVDQCTLGCGAMSGTSLDVDRLRVMRLLGFARLCENTIDSVSATDHVMQAAAALASTMNVIARFCQDLYIWSSQECGMMDVSDAFSSPSSLMPQKKNALVLEYVRSRAARVIGDLTASHAVTQNVGYMDTEEVEIEAYLPLYEAFAAADEALPTVAALIPAMQPNRELMRARAAWGFSSVTALAEAIQTQQGLSYRTAHRVVARAVLMAVEQGGDANSIDTALLDTAAREMIDRSIVMSGDEITRCLDPRRFVEQHKTLGGTAPAEVHRMAGLRREALASSGAAVAERLRRVRRADQELREAVASLIGSEPPATGAR